MNVKLYIIILTLTTLNRIIIFQHVTQTLSYFLSCTNLHNIVDKKKIKLKDVHSKFRYVWLEIGFLIANFHLIFAYIPP